MKLVHPPRKKPIILAASIAAVVIILAVTIILIVKHTTATKADAPQYSTILPDGTSIDDLGGWTRISPTTAAAVYAYNDTIDQIPVTVSEQPLPPAFKSDTDTKISDLAKSYNATDKINADGISVYVGTSAKGPQSTIFTKKGLLVLIKSQSKVDDKSWITYVHSLN